MTTTLALAARLRALPDAGLVAALRTRPIRRTGVSDFFDLAEALLDPEAVQRALTGLDRTRLAALALLGRAGGALDAAALARGFAAHPATAGAAEREAAGALADLAEAFLVHPGDSQYAAYPAVTATIEPRAEELLATAPPTALALVPDADQRFTDRLAAERAFEAVAAVSELLAELGRGGARELQKGGLALPATKRLAEALSVEASVVPVVLSIAGRAGLAAVGDGSWLPTEAASGWLHSAAADRWRVLAAGWWEALPAGLRSLLARRNRATWGESLREHIAWLYPAAAAEAQRRMEAHTREAEWLGVTAQQAPSSAGTALVTSGPETAAGLLAGLFPAQVDRVYLQHDLTVVSPGPLAPNVETRLRTMAEVESRALASTFRFSTASIDRAVTAGETAASILDFLAAVSLTGVPQPLDYLIADAVERHGRVRVRSSEDGGSLVYTADATLVQAIAVDHSLRALRLVRDDATLTSPLPRDAVYWALSDARYPVVAEDDAGAPVALRRQRVAPPPVATARDPDAEFVARLREADGGAGADTTGAVTAEQWLARQLDQAVRARQPIIVEVALPDGRIVDYQLEPTGVGGGRLRGRDRAADIERTLPLSSVKGLRSVD
ncbi:hypothetical protein O159_06830 [Leifsonia xyli subsp. cynodontis DSM 46306]|uniref:Helicase XPB/Ssl2 N-terminal domain-containing protein n=1 Tax=Leifsonia xyli subsp. cynodontis DSM 46306 TaxID=1389489 RepID=U3P3J4_LEIXC|nr:helicase-associated domain-containing protein [Leifsonia xyli]AGW40860.1 hypothetical protein O159_06830 [Leifsonia xyli subsp. cynodontis DSM 46306]